MFFKFEQYTELENELAFKKIFVNKIKKYFAQYEGNINLSDNEAMKKICPSIYKYGYNSQFGYYALKNNLLRYDEDIHYDLFEGFPVLTISEAFNLLLLSYLKSQTDITAFFNCNNFQQQFQKEYQGISYDANVINYANIYNRLLKINNGNVPENVKKIILDRINSQYCGIEWFYDEINNQINYRKVKTLNKKSLDF